MLVTFFDIFIVQFCENERKGLLFMYLLRRILYFGCFLSVLLHAQSVETMLQEFNVKNDLSQKTIDENKGHLILFTREKLEQMHAKTLKDVFKTTPVIYYHENRYALPDPLAGGSFSPYLSNFIRLYVDGVEITQGWMGSGLLLYGDINIDFVDHIEFYYAIPSFETSVEPAYLTIFLYSKDPNRDNGGKIDLVQGSRGYNSQSLSYGETTDKLSYMVNLSHTDAKREKVSNGTNRPLSRDFERTQLFSYIKSDKQFAHLQIMEKKTDALAGLSLDATPLVSNIDYLNLHFDYGITLSEHWKAQFAFEWLKADLALEDDTPLIYLGSLFGTRFNAVSKNSTYSAELTYHEKIGDHHITAGIKDRLKKLDSVSVEGYGDMPLNFTSENIGSVFFQDQYALSERELLTLGLEYSRLTRNYMIKDDDLLQLRLGYIFTSERWSYKTYLYRTMFSLDPFSRNFDPSTLSDVPPQATVGITQEIAYTPENYRLRLMLLLMRDQDGLLKNGASAKTRYFFSIVNYDYTFDTRNALHMQLYYANYQDIFNLHKLEDYSGYFSLMNGWGNFDFYNGIVWHQNSIDHTNYFDLTSTISWNATENLTLTLKGDNLLDKAKRSDLQRINPLNGTLLTPLSISPIDRRITVELEYTF